MPNVNEQLKLIKNKRTFLNKNLLLAEKYLGQNDDSLEAHDIIYRQFQTCEDLFVDYSSHFKESYDADVEAFNDCFDEGEVVNVLFSKLKIQVNKLFNENNPSEVHTPRSPALNESKTCVTNCVSKLPKIKLPTFDGKFEQWISFKNQFTELIDKNESLSNITKLQYLKVSLTGEAADVIAGLEITSENYVHAFESLKERFEHTRLIVNNHIRALFEMEIIHKENYQGFRKILDLISQHTRALIALNRPVQEWDDLLVYLTLTKLPFSTRKEWENKISNTEVPEFKTLKDFLIHKCHTLEVLNPKNQIKSVDNRAQCNLAVKYNVCAYCKNSNHYTNQCDYFLKLPVKERVNYARTKKLCLNCLKEGHNSYHCKLKSRCKTCQKSHNSLLHLINVRPNNEHNNTSSSFSNENTLDTKSKNCPPSYVTTALQTSKHTRPAQVLLSTCIVKVKGGNNEYRDARILLDSGSQVNFITDKLADELELKRFRTSLPIIGINEKRSESAASVKTELRSKCSSYQVELEFYVLNKLTGSQPIVTFDTSNLKLPDNIKLADPRFFESREVDILLGAQIFYNLLRMGQIRTEHKGLVIQNSVFGWLMAGSIPDNICKTAYCNLSFVQDLDKHISRFWEIEQLPESQIKSIEEIECEKHFTKTIKRDNEGRFVASLPFKLDPACLGNSLDSAKSRFLNLERKLLNNPVAKDSYDEFINEYLQLGHMQEIGTLSKGKTEGYFLPHHAVYKPESLTTKIRVVFDASAKTSTNISLNDILMMGPVLQNDLFSILIRFRLHRYVIMADISKMYRQIFINPAECKFQKILWRFSPSEEIKIYELKTLTYGTRSASFIATRCLKELALNAENNELISQIINSDFYMDDLITGCDSVAELKNIQRNVSQLLAEGGFFLRKWASNSSAVLQELSLQNQENFVIKCGETDTLKTLGIRWSPNQDKLEYCTKVNKSQVKCTKRAILSNIAQLFDPLGLLGPVIVIAKLIMQELWKLQLGWDDMIPVELQKRWLKFIEQLPSINSISVPRMVIGKGNGILELHGFADASERAYGACIYLRVVMLDNTVSCYLLSSKSRIAPIKTLCLPRLELCAAVLLTELMSKVISIARIKFNKINYYSDSTIVLSWINSCPSKWKTFVAHRVAEIQAKSEARFWYHVSSQDNPADVLSRGAYPLELENHKLWWVGPSWLLTAELKLNMFENKLAINNIPEAKVLTVVIDSPKNEYLNSIIERYSGLSKLKRVTAYVLRFLNNCTVKQKKDRLTNFLTVNELEKALLKLVKVSQMIHLTEDYNSLIENKPLKKKSSLLSLNPFLDENRLIRVGGRLTQSDLLFDKRHPIILPKNSHITKLILRYEHVKQLHVGASALLNIVREKFWPIAGKNIAKSIVRACTICFRFNPKAIQPLMGTLPKNRSTVMPPFFNVGIDYAGPFHIKENGTRRAKSTKGYIALFICFATKCLHLELVTSLTTEAFLAALRRFVSRRGKPLHIYSDNGTNFQGAKTEIKELYEFLKKQSNFIGDNLSNLGLNWHFIPVNSPHMGGLWEAGVKSVKSHLKKVMYNCSLTYEEFHTVLVQIEAILNSRPLTPISSDPNDTQALTPSHFLIGRLFTSVPDPNVLNIKINRLGRYQFLQKISQDFWKRWSREYLSSLQQRSKWKENGYNLELGALVLIKEDNQPPAAWRLARVHETHPGTDGVVRVVTLKCKDHFVKRAVSRICVLPVQD